MDGMGYMKMVLSTTVESGIFLMNMGVIVV